MTAFLNIYLRIDKRSEFPENLVNQSTFRKGCGKLKNII